MIREQWDRQELYEKVWQFPLRKLAHEYGISDVGLAKVCRKLKIPLPGLGHWTKIACGHKIPRPSLPPIENVPVLVRHVREVKTLVLPEDAPRLNRLEQIAAEASLSVTKAMLAHPLIEKSRVALIQSRAKEGEKLWAARDTECLDLRVTKNMLTRALRIMAALIHLLEREGFKVAIEKTAPESTRTTIYDEEIRFGLIERFRQIKSEPSPKDSKYSYNPVRLEPTGMLSVEIWNYYFGGPQKVWRDRESMKLEELVPKCVAGMMRIALKERADAKARRDRELARQNRIAKVEAELEKIRAEEKRIKTLRKEVVAWHRAQRIRDYLAEARESGVKDAEWIAWAQREADRLDPLKPTPASIVDNKEEVVKRLHEVHWGW
jgi:hypothetical protein